MWGTKPPAPSAVVALDVPVAVEGAPQLGDYMVTYFRGEGRREFDRCRGSSVYKAIVLVTAETISRISLHTMLKAVALFPKFDHTILCNG